MIHSTTAIFLDHYIAKPLPLRVDDNLLPTMCLAIGDLRQNVHVYGTLGELQQFGAQLTAAVRDAVERKLLAPEPVPR